METVAILTIAALVLCVIAFLIGYEFGERQKTHALNATYKHGHEIGLMKGQRMRTLGGRQ